LAKVHGRPAGAQESKSMQAFHWAILLSVGLFLGMLLCLEGGFRLGNSGIKRSPELAHEGIGVIEAAMFALLGLLLAFSLAGGMSRLEIRRQQIVEEANAIGTAYLRLDLLPKEDQPEMRRLFREYLDARLQVYEEFFDPQPMAQATVRVEQLQEQIWNRVVAASRTDASANIGRLLLPAVNQMIDITTTRLIASRTHLPSLILVLLTSVALLSGLIAGYAMAKRRSRSWLHMALYAAVVAVTVYAVVDLDYPRTGFIKVNAADQAIQNLRRSIR
jgi:hypothetical protein